MDCLLRQPPVVLIPQQPPGRPIWSLPDCLLLLRRVRETGSVPVREARRDEGHASDGPPPERACRRLHGGFLQEARPSEGGFQSHGLLPVHDPPSGPPERSSPVAIEVGRDSSTVSLSATGSPYGADGILQGTLSANALRFDLLRVFCRSKPWS